jgi:hypothetical protein
VGEVALDGTAFERSEQEPKFAVIRRSLAERNSLLLEAHSTGALLII